MKLLAILFAFLHVITAPFPSTHQHDKDELPSYSLDLPLSCECTESENIFPTDFVKDCNS